MKADVVPAKPLRLDIPSWVPDVIAQYVNAWYAADVDSAYREALKKNNYFEPDVLPEACLNKLLRDDVFRASIADLVHDDELANIIERYRPLACDPRIEGVWRELSRQSSSGGFLHPAIDADQDAAMFDLFNVAFKCREQYGATTTQKEAEQQRDCDLAKADKLRRDAIMMLVQPPLFHEGPFESVNKCYVRYQKLQDAAQAYEDLASEIYAANSAMALERKHDRRAHWVALTVGNTFRRLFGQPMYGLTATITSVAIGREIKLETVRKWLDPVIKGPKISS